MGLPWHAHFVPTKVAIKVDCNLIEFSSVVLSGIILKLSLDSESQLMALVICERVGFFLVSWSNRHLSFFAPDKYF